MSPARGERRQKKHPNLRRGAPEKNGKKTATRFQPGNPGRPKGVLNKVTREVKEFARGILEDPIVQQRTLEDARKGRLAPPIHSMLFHYAYGKPKDSLAIELIERLEVEITDDIAGAGEPDAAETDA